MAKKKKTRQEKILADLRRKTVQSQPAATLPSSYAYQVNENHLKAEDAAKTVTTVSYPYLRADLLKTSVLTGSLIIIELLLFFLLKNHIINLPIQY